jgi:hypothetical protein
MSRSLPRILAPEVHMDQTELVLDDVRSQPFVN